MLEKMMNASKKNILLRFMVVPLALLLVILPLIPSASAFAYEYELIDYNDYVYNTVFDGTNDHVYIRFPESLCNISLWTYYPTTQFVDSVVGNSATWELQEAYRYYSNAYPMGYGIDAADSPKLDLSNIPNGTSIHFDITYNWSYYDGETGLINTPTYDAWAIYYNAAGYVVSSQQFTAGTTPGEGPSPTDTWSFDLTINKPSGATSLFVYAQLDSMLVYEEGEITFTLSNFTMDFSVAALYRLQQQTGKNSAVLSSIETELRQQGQTIEEFVTEQQKTNEKLDKLPGEIGDEMQGVIENEKQEAESSGNDFVDEILDALPDPSADVLVALKRLTDAMAYTGTDAVLPIPALVLPGIDGLFPETEIWGGASFDFGEYIIMLPSTLLSLVRSLFTIAIVIFCALELKGIISYCLTLRESKGG